MGEIDHTIPAFVEDFDQGIAMLAYYLRNVTPLNNQRWIYEGLSKKSALPWERKWAEERKEAAIREAKWNETPKAIIPYAFYKLTLREVKTYIQANESELVFTFKDSIFKIRSENLEVGCIAKGVSSENEIRISNSALEKWPKRIRKNYHVIFLMDNYLHFAENKILISNYLCGNK